MAIVTLQKEFGLPVGISDHSAGLLVPIAAVALGAKAIEKHVTFDRTLPGPDHPFATTVDELGDMVQQIRLLEQALGNGQKIPTERPIIERCNVILDCAKRHATLSGQYLELTNAEFNILEMLIKSPGQAFSKEELTAFALGRKYTPYDRALMFT